MEHLKEVLRKAEIKRVGERLTKKELCNIYKFNYNFYMNCVIGRNLPSVKMVEHLQEYLETPTPTIYNMVFASRDQETSFHKGLNLTDEESESLLAELASKNIYQEPR